VSRIESTIYAAFRFQRYSRTLISKQREYCIGKCLMKSCGAAGELNGGCQDLNITLPGLSSPPPPGAPTTPGNQGANNAGMSSSHIT
jgi:hypothetical protein